MANRIEQALRRCGCASGIYRVLPPRASCPEGAEIRGSVEQPKDTCQRRLCRKPCHGICQDHAHGAAQDRRGAHRAHGARRLWLLPALRRRPAFELARLTSGIRTCCPPSRSPADYGRVDDGHGEKVMVVFVSANPTGPMTIGNDARRRARRRAFRVRAERAGYKCSGEFYVTMPAIRSTCSASPSRRATSSSSRVRTRSNSRTTATTATTSRRFPRQAHLRA